MEVRLGYKRTEVGVVPRDWNVSALKTLGNAVRGGSPRPAGDPRYFDGSFIPWLTVSALTNIPPSQLVVRETATCLTEQGSLRSRKLSPGTLIIANSGATLGVAKILGIECCANDGIAALLNIKDDVSCGYLAHLLNSKTEYLRKVVATGNGQPNLNTTLIGNFSVQLPSTKQEQDHIAAALDGIDALIDSLEQLLAKKRQIKQGAMQELLTGKRRLVETTSPRFRTTAIGELPAEWQAIALGRLTEVKTGPFGSALHERDYVNDGTPIITVEHLGENGISHERTPMVSEHDFKRLRSYVLEEGDIVFSRVGSVDRNARVSPLEEGWLFSGRLLRLRMTSRGVDSRYLSYQFHSEPFKQRVRSVAVGQTMASLNTKIVQGIPVAIPAIEEQVAIADTLDGMNQDCQKLEQKLSKVREMKQGMMQELLTGRIRLV